MILFDGICNLCTRSVQFILKRDPRSYFRFASLQSPAGQRLLQAYGLPPNLVESVILIEHNRVYGRSDAALRIASHLSGGWPLLRVLLIVPRPIRDAVYSWIANRRYRWFGTAETCLVPSPNMRARFLE
ncbi:MAG: thiol-disulfide oxidoreductase DCC family protein [Chloroflexi bacterium]|nr:thiol-disulfide oxidoreductase DCC family protein [Chloroflexota bacterium]